MPCKDDAECLGEGRYPLPLFCVPDGTNGAFCLPPCDQGCPEGYVCDDANSAWCRPESGACPCSVFAIETQAETNCWVENQWGLCPGTRQCTPFGVSPCSAPEPGPELCNGQDDDCDQEVDEGVSWGDCLVTSDWGFCDGTLSCANGQLVCLGPKPGPELCDAVDNNCNGLIDEGWPDWDGDGKTLCVDLDNDGDGIADETDNCIMVQNAGQEDSDDDGEGDVCDEDDDDDGWKDSADCEPLDPFVSPGALESCNGVDDDCDLVWDEGFPDTDWDNIADCIDWDDDGDGIADEFDCLPLDPTSFPGAPELCDGADNDCDGVADNDLPDADNDGIPNCLDADADGDDVEDSIDNCPAKPNGGQGDLDEDGLGDLCDTDNDGDGVPMATDNCSNLFNPGQANQDGDGWGNACDWDDDADSVVDAEDNCPAVANEDQQDTDSDGYGDACDVDDDDDGLADAMDCHPLDPFLPSQAAEVCNSVDDDCDQRVDEGFVDGDMDGTPDCLDPDDDDDGDADVSDCEPLNPGVGHGVPETCNGMDDDCDGEVDEEQPLLTCGLGVCKHSVVSCDAGTPVFCNPFLGSTTEECDGLDNDCDGQMDEGFAAGAPCTTGEGFCASTGQWVCTADGTATECIAPQLAPKCGESQCGPDGCGGSCGTCDDSLACTHDTCEGGTCQFEVAPGFCVIDGDCVEAGTQSTEQPCFACIPTESKDQWSPAWDGYPCGETGTCSGGGCCVPDCQGKECGDDGCMGTCGECHLQWCVTPLCQDGLCEAGPVMEGACLIEGVCRAAGEFKDGNPCLWCQPEKQQDDWSSRHLEMCGQTAWCSYGTCCDHGQACEEVECGKGTCGSVDCGDCGCGGFCLNGLCADTKCGCRQCGDDGCGGDCGQCPVGQQCVDGYCASECDDGNQTPWDGCTQGVCAEFVTAPTPFLNQQYPSATSMHDGRFVVAWSGPTASDKSAVSYQVFESDGKTVGSVGTANTHVEGSQDSVDLCARPGGFVAVWESGKYGNWEPAQDGSDGGIYGRLFASDGTPDSEEFQVHAFVSGNQGDPSVGCFEDGGFVAAWHDTSVSSYSVEFALFLPDATRVGTESIAATAPKSTTLGGAGLAVLDNDSFVIIWNQKDELWDQEVLVRVLAKDGTAVTDPVPVNTFHDHKQWQAEVAPTPEGGFVVGWVSAFQVSETSGQDGSYEGVYMRAFDAQGSPLTDEVAVNSCILGEQDSLRLAVLPDGLIAVAWQSTPKGGHPAAGGPFVRMFDVQLQPLGSDIRLDTWGDTLSSKLGETAHAGDGRFLALFQRHNPSTGTYELYSRFFDSAGQPCCGALCSD